MIVVDQLAAEREPYLASGDRPGCKMTTSCPLAAIRGAFRQTRLHNFALDMSWVPDHPKLSGGQQMLSDDILRGGYRLEPTNPKPIEPHKVLPYRLRLPNVCHMFSNQVWLLLGLAGFLPFKETRAIPRKEHLAVIEKDSAFLGAIGDKILSVFFVFSAV
jgi:hypothetical protein